MSNKIKIAVSSCLLGEAVRYDGTDKHIRHITEQLVHDYNLISLCPEMAVGMGVPRPPIHLLETNNGIEVVELDNSNINFTKPLSSYGKEVVKNHPEICGYIFKKNSPSCGTKNVKVMNNQGDYERRGQGIYASSIIQALPLLPVIDEEDFLIDDLRILFISDVIEYSKKQK